MALRGGEVPELLARPPREAVDFTARPEAAADHPAADHKIELGAVSDCSDEQEPRGLDQQTGLFTDLTPEPIQRRLAMPHPPGGQPPRHLLVRMVENQNALLLVMHDPDHSKEKAVVDDAGET